jgi:hypothetical protein
MPQRPPRAPIPFGYGARIRGARGAVVSSPGEPGPVELFRGGRRGAKHRTSRASPPHLAAAAEPPDPQSRARARHFALSANHTWGPAPAGRSSLVAARASHSGGRRERAAAGAGRRSARSRGRRSSPAAGGREKQCCEPDEGLPSRATLALMPEALTLPAPTQPAPGGSVATVGQWFKVGARRCARKVSGLSLCG